MNKLVLAAFLLFATPAHAQAPEDGLAALLQAKMQRERIPALQVAVVQHGKIIGYRAVAVPLTVGRINRCVSYRR